MTQDQDFATGDPLQHPQYRFGDDVSLWPLAKVARAREHANRLASQLDMWASTTEMHVHDDFSDDRTRWRLRLRLETPPPLLHWSTSLGDVVHNLRSALDAAIWQFAALNCTQSPPSRELMFPVVQDERAWDSAVRRRLPGVPAAVVARVRFLQPFGVAGEYRSRHPLVLLQSLSNADKHQAAIHCRCRANAVEGSFFVEFGDEEAAERNVPPGFEFAVPELVDGAILGQWAARDPIQNASAKFTVSFEPVIQIGEDQHPLGHVVTELLRFVEVAQVILHSGVDASMPAQQGVVVLPE